MIIRIMAIAATLFALPACQVVTDVQNDWEQLKLIVGQIKASRDATAGAPRDR